jgi:hypothetical protein
MLLACDRFHISPGSPAIVVALFGILVQASGANPSVQRIPDVAVFWPFKIG